uniref:Uncharacterized protein n=1 Tax=Anopheles melas TaxID=34690 RepID=A0A182TUM0_9DIPT
MSDEFFVRSSQSAFSRRAVQRKSIGVCSRKRDMMLRSHLAMWFLRDSPGLRSGSCDTRSSSMKPDDEVDACAFTRNPSSFSTHPRSTSARRTVWKEPRSRKTRWCLVASCTFFRSSFNRSALIQLFLYGLINFTVAVSGPKLPSITFPVVVVAAVVVGLLPPVATTASLSVSPTRQLPVSSFATSFPRCSTEHQS